jgi:hypothetical protein
MTWLLALYPPSWRRRYGDELRALLGSQRFSLHVAIDLIGGAIDAWLEPQNIPIGPAAVHKEGVAMIGTTMKLGCGARPSREDAWKSAGVNVGGTLLLGALWMWMQRYIPLENRIYANSFSPMAFLVPMLFSFRYTSLKGRSIRAQAIFIGGMIVILTVILGIAGRIAMSI